MNPRNLHPSHVPTASSDGPWRVAFAATLHCLTGCAVGEVLGLVIGTGLGWGNVATTALAVVLAFVSGYALTLAPLRRHGLPWRAAAGLGLRADSASIVVMELVDNAVMWLIPGAMDATLSSPLFWGSMALSLGVALLAAWPLNLWLIGRGLGHAVVHAHHDHHGHHARRPVGRTRPLPRQGA